MNKLIFLSFILIIFIITGNDNTFSYPKFAALTGEKCVSCHINPTGGGIRGKYGLFYSKKNLYLKPFEKFNKDSLFNPQLNKSIQIGSDFRLIFIDNERGKDAPHFNTFFQMQGDVYVNARLNNYMNLVMGLGMDYPNTFDKGHLQVKSELYGLVNNLPLGIYFKVGRFIQNFGLKIPEHRAYTRQYNDFYTPYAADAGIEFGISPSLFTFTLGLSNGNSKDIYGNSNNSYDFDTQKQFTSSLDFRWISKNEKYSFGFGGSYINNPFKYDMLNDVNAVRQIAAGFLSIGLFNRVSILGEYDYNRLNLRDSINSKRDMSTAFAEIDFRIINGLELKTQFESFDNQLGIKNDSTHVRRYSFGLVIFPLTGMEMESMFRILKGEGDLLDHYNEFQQTFKFYF